MYTCVGWLRPRVLTIVPSGMKMLATADRLRQQAAGVVAQVEDQRLRAPCLSTFCTWTRSSAAESSVNCQLEVAELDALVVDERRAATGTTSSRA